MLEQERKTKTKTIGNFLLLEKPRVGNDPDQEKDAHEKMLKALGKVTNEPFGEKSNVMKQYLSTLVCSGWFRDKDRWDETEVQKRNRGFATTVIPNVWPI